MRNLTTSTTIYLALFAFLIFVKVIFLLFPTTFPLAEQEGAFSWTTIAVIILIEVEDGDSPEELGFLTSGMRGFPTDKGFSSPS